MNILIFGASGNTGYELVRQALNQGHKVTAFVRSPDKLKISNENLTVIRGDVKDYSSVENAIKNQDAVISALGVSKPLKKDPVVVEGIKNIIKAMEQMNVKRFIYLSFVAVGESRNNAGFILKNIVSRIVHNEIEDHEEKESIIKSSSLEWTIVKPPKLSNGKQKGKYRSGENIKAGSILPMMSRTDVADFMLTQLSDRTFLHKAVSVMY